MSDIRAAIQEKMPLTVSEMFAVAKEYDTRVVDVVLLETELRTGLSREEILTGIMNEYAHNLKAVEIGVKDGESILLGTVASQLAAQSGPKCFEDPFLDDALLYTLGAQWQPLHRPASLRRYRRFLPLLRLHQGHDGPRL